MSSLSPLGSSITLSRTFPPALPPHYLTRRHLFPLLENLAPGTTMVIAPAGYGKSSLVSEWSEQYRDRTIWLTLTESDPLQEMAALFIQATRNILPGFAPWFEENQPMLASDVVRRWGNELRATGKDYIFVLDNLRDNYIKDVNVANKLIEQFPQNVHLVVIRRTPLQSLYDTCIARGVTKIIGVNELRFTEEEIESFAQYLNADIADKQVRKVALAAQGWPSATSLILHQIAEKGSVQDIESQLKAKGSPLEALAKITFERFDDATKELLKRLSIVEEFDFELAQIILEDLYDYSALSNLAAEGEIFSQRIDPELTYIYSPLIRAVALDLLKAVPEIKLRLHEKLAAFFEARGQFDLAMDNYFAAGNQSKVSLLFRDAARLKQAQGRGDVLIKWASYAGMSPIDGAYKKQTMLIMGEICNFDFVSAQAEIEKLKLTNEKATDPLFFKRFAAASQCFIDLAYGRFDAFDRNAELALSQGDGEGIAPEDRVMIYRLMATRAYLFDQVVVLEDICAKAREESANTLLATSHAYLAAMESQLFFLRGEFRKAFELASSALKQFQKLGIVGILGPLDIYHVLGRCLVEFTKPEESLEYYKLISNLSKSWSQWHWYATAEGYLARRHAKFGRNNEAMEIVSALRLRSEELFIENQLGQLIDLTELAVRYLNKDWDHVGKLLARVTPSRYTENYRLAYVVESGKRETMEDPERMPERTPLEKIMKHLNKALNLKDEESKALSEMKQAMRIGSQVGAKEMFLQQGKSIGNLILKVASESPTVYNEELARAMALRIKEREMSKDEQGHSLTKREVEILRHLTTGRTLTIISGELHISQNTMKTHLKNLYRKLEAKDREDAVNKAKQLHLI